MASEFQLIKDDPWLQPYGQDIADRYDRFVERMNQLKETSDGLYKFANGHQYFGFQFDRERKGWWYREWAPAAHHLALIGDFNGWNPGSHPMNRVDNGNWEIFLPGDLLKHEQKVKVQVHAANGVHDRIPAYIKRTVQDPDTHDFSGQIWAPPTPFHWTDQHFKLENIGSPVIYEAHVGMAQEKEGVGTYKEFETEVLPRIKRAGYNCIQMMAVQEHPYYGSFGYHVSSFFAPASRFGTPEELKSLINKAHEMGIAVIMDIVHSHAVKNIAEGLNQFDGTEDQYFHPGERGEHGGWDSKLFNYGKPEVQQYLLSNVRYWLEEFHFDGFRFDGVTSMLYFHHGEGVAFDHYDKYFKEGAEWDAILYLQLANQLTHLIKPHALSIAEDMSGMPGLCRHIGEGGMGFDYRLGMGIPDYWIKTLKHVPDEEWNLREIWGTLNNRRYKEKTIAYAESHDQALVGDKTLAFWLMDKEMYFHMTIGDDHDVIDRGIALHKMIRLITIALGGEGYLNFIGNEFGHPEWVDFPREGNDWSYKHARRQWKLADSNKLKYKWLANFDKAMIQLVKRTELLSKGLATELNIDEQNKVLIFQRGSLVFAFNFNISYSIPDYKFFVPEGGKYVLALSSDESHYGGFDRVSGTEPYSSFEEDGVQKLSVYLPCRTAIVLEKK